MDTETQVDERSATQPSIIIDRVFSIVFLVAQPFLAVAQYLIIALGADWTDGTRSIPHWAATTGIVLVILIPLAAAGATLVMLAQRRIAFWVPLLAMVVTSVMVLALSTYAQTDI